MTVVLETTGLMKSFGGVQVIDDLSMQLHDGEALGIVGPNGAGKTTLFNLITGVYRPDAGRVTFDGKDITGLARQDRCRAGIGRTFQIPKPFSDMSVFENVCDMVHPRAVEFSGRHGRRQVRQDGYREDRRGFFPRAGHEVQEGRLMDRRRSVGGRRRASDSSDASWWGR